MTPEEAAKLGRHDADHLLSIARQRPVAGKELPAWKLKLKSPRDYEDSPELPARRVATYWDDYKAGQKGFDVPQPPIVVKLRRGRPVDPTDDEAWDAWSEALLDRLKQSRVLLVQARTMEYFGPAGGSYAEVDSLYVVNLNRYEQVPVPRWEDESALGGSAVDERAIQFAFVPRKGRGRIRRWLMRRKARRLIESVRAT